MGIFKDIPTQCYLPPKEIDGLRDEGRNDGFHKLRKDKAGLFLGIPHMALWGWGRVQLLKNSTKIGVLLDLLGFVESCFFFK